jgi:predicted nucleotidyltransferase
VKIEITYNAEYDRWEVKTIQDDFLIAEFSAHKYKMLDFVSELTRRMVDVRNVEIEQFLIRENTNNYKEESNA